MDISSLGIEYQAEEPPMGDSKVSLYGGETLATIAGFPTIYYFQRSEIPSPAGSQKPLIVCVPGGVHLGRIFYGGHDGSDPKDFLAHHLGQRGFDVLCLSYPLENNIMPPTAADFRVPDWGRQAALTAQQVIDDNALSIQSIVLIGWSMGGRMPVAFNIAAKELGLEVRQFISFCATPGISQIRDIKSDLQCSNAGYSSIPTRMEGFYQQLEEVNSFNGGREVIPRDIYFPQYTGAMPVNLPGCGLSYDGKGSFIKDAAVHERETSVFDIENQILSTALYPTGIMDAGHAIADKATWGFLLTLKLEAMVKQKIPSLRGTPKWPKLIELIHSAPNRLCVPVVGNHFFFVGKESACRAAEAVESLIDDTNLFREELSQLII